MKTIKLNLMILFLGVVTCSMALAQNYKAPAIDASGKIMHEHNVVIGSFTKEGVISDAAGKKIAYINSNGMFVNNKGNI